MMSVEMKKNLTISDAAMLNIEQRMAELTAQGVMPTEADSTELNMSGCASGYCQAWA